MIDEQSSEDSLEMDLGMEHVEDALIVPVEVSYLVVMLAESEIEFFVLKHSCRLIFDNEVI